MRLLRLRLPVRRVLRGWFRFVVLVGAPAVCSVVLSFDLRHFDRTRNKTTHMQGPLS